MPIVQHNPSGSRTVLLTAGIAWLLASACNASRGHDDTAHVPVDVGIAADTALPPADANDADARPDTAAPEDVVSVIDAPIDVPDTHADTTPELVVTARCRAIGRDTRPNEQLVAYAYDDIECTADAPGAATFHWEFVSMPATAFGFTTSGTDTPTFTLSHAFPGQYMLRVTATDASGETSATADVQWVVIAAPNGFSVQITWDDADAETPPADLELHVLHPAECWGDEAWDIDANSPDVDWGEVWHHPSGGLEDFRLTPPATRGAFTVAVRVPANTQTTATARLFVHGDLYFEQRDRSLSTDVERWWVVFAFDFRAYELTPMDTVFDHLPPCP